MDRVEGLRGVLSSVPEDDLLASLAAQTTATIVTTHYGFAKRRIGNSELTGWSSRNLVTSYTLSLMINQQSFAVLCLATSALVYCFGMARIRGLAVSSDESTEQSGGIPSFFLYAAKTKRQRSTQNTQQQRQRTPATKPIAVFRRLSSDTCRHSGRYSFKSTSINRQEYTAPALHCNQSTERQCV